MSELLPIGPGPHRSDNVRGAIARAAERTGIDFNYLLAQAKLESRLDPAARAQTSSAAGLYQFTNGTWLQTLDRHGASHGLGWAEEAIEGGRLRDPAMRAQVMGLRYDADASALMAAELANDNRAALSVQLGRDPDAAELYLAHFLGIGGAGQFLTALATDPGQSAAAILPQAAAANRAIFYQASGEPRSVGGVMELLRGKVAAAMEGSFLPSSSREGIEGWGVSSWQSLAAKPHPNSSPQGDGPSIPPPRPSMSDTLRDTFGLARNDETPGIAHAAYTRLRSFGL
ncbi:MAG: lytic transglycosylase domain-containing protein [Novosphingobium sp.]